MRKDRIAHHTRNLSARAAKRGGSTFELLMVLGLMCVASLAGFRKYGRVLLCKAEGQAATVQHLEAGGTGDACDESAKASRPRPTGTGASSSKPAPTVSAPSAAPTADAPPPVECPDGICKTAKAPCVDADGGAFWWTKTMLAQLIVASTVATTPPAFTYAPDPKVATDGKGRVTEITTGTHWGEPKVMRVEERNDRGSPTKISLSGSTKITLTQVADYNWKISGEGRSDSYFNGEIWMDKRGLVMKDRRGTKVTTYTTKGEREDRIYLDAAWTSSRTETWDNQGDLKELRFSRRVGGSDVGNTRYFEWNGKHELTQVHEAKLAGLVVRDGDSWVDGSDNTKRYKGDYKMTPTALVFQMAKNDKGITWWRAQPHDQPLSKGKWANMTPAAMEGLEAFRKKAIEQGLLPKEASSAEAFALAMSTAEVYADLGDKLGDALDDELKKAAKDPNRAGAKALDEVSNVPQVVRGMAARFRKDLDDYNLDRVLVELGQKQIARTFKDTMHTIETARPSVALQVVNHAINETVSLPRKMLEEFSESPWKVAGTVAVAVLAPEFKVLDVVKKVTGLVALAQAGGKTVMGVYYLSTGERDRGAKLVGQASAEVIEEVLQDKILDKPSMAHGSAAPCPK